MFFLFMGVSTGIGTFAHALNGTDSIQLCNSLFMAMTICSSFAVFFALKATIFFTSLNYLTKKIFNWINLSLLIIFLIYTLGTNNFEIFKMHAAAGLLLIFITHSIAWWRSHTGSGWIMGGMGISFVTVLVHTKQFSFSPWFNYKDISHVIMMASLVLIYNGVHMMSENLKLSVFRANMSAKED